MQNTTPLFPGFHLQTLRKTPRSARQILAEKAQQLKQKSFSQLGECFGKFIPHQHLQPTTSGVQSRRRIFSKENTFWAFFSQVLDADGGCKLKRVFANDPENIIPVNASENRRKGAKGPNEWMPLSQKCEYLRQWRSIVNRYGLAFSDWPEC